MLPRSLAHSLAVADGSNHRNSRRSSPISPPTRPLSTSDTSRSTPTTPSPLPRSPSSPPPRPTRPESFDRDDRTTGRRHDDSGNKCNRRGFPPGAPLWICRCRDAMTTGEWQPRWRLDEGLLGRRQQQEQCMCADVCACMRVCMYTEAGLEREVCQLTGWSIRAGSLCPPLSSSLRCVSTTVASAVVAWERGIRTGMPWIGGEGLVLPTMTTSRPLQTLLLIMPIVVTTTTHRPARIPSGGPPSFNGALGCACGFVGTTADQYVPGHSRDIVKKGSRPTIPRVSGPVSFVISLVLLVRERGRHRCRRHSMNRPHMTDNIDVCHSTVELTTPRPTRTGGKVQDDTYPQSPCYSHSWGLLMGLLEASERQRLY